MDAHDIEDRLRLFVSYSRKDVSFIDRLAPALADAGFLPDYDRSILDLSCIVTGIAPDEAWWPRLREMITIADVVVFVVSPDSAASRVCDEEIGFAQTVGKRIVPILCREVDFSALPPRLSALNVSISFAAEIDFADSFVLLVDVLRRDLRWFREAGRIAELVRQWQEDGRTPDQLLRGAALRAVEDWAARRPASAPPHPEALLAFLSASREAEAERNTVTQVEKARYLRLMDVLRPLLAEELRVREAMPTPRHGGVADEHRVETEHVRSLLQLDGRWHPEPAVHLTSLGARDGYAEIFRFPCCGRVVQDFLVVSTTGDLSQFRVDGCVTVPEQLWHSYRNPPNPFESQLVRRYRELLWAAKSQPAPGPTGSTRGSAVS